jgi:hypothetical protein
MGSSSKPQTVNNVTQYPTWMEKPMQENIGRANEIADQRDAAGYQGYSAENRIAGFNPAQTQAMEASRNFSGAWMPNMQSANGMLENSNFLAMQAAAAPTQNFSMNAAFAGPSAMVQAGNVAGANLTPYMSPWTNQVTRGALENLDMQRQSVQLQNADAATKAKAFGGSRQALLEAQTNQGFAKSASDLALNSAQQNYQNAQSMANTDISRNLQAQQMNQGAYNNMQQYNAQLAQQANQFNAGQSSGRDMDMRRFGLEAAQAMSGNAMSSAQLGSMLQSLGTNDINNLLTAGNMQQDQEQSVRDWNYGQWQNQQNFPLDNLGIRQGAITNTPYQPGSSTTQNITRNRTSGFLGGAQQGYGATNSWWGALAGGLLGAYG